MPNQIHRDVRCATVFIDLKALQHNALIAKSLSPNADFLCMIKANAYGHGIVETANALDKIADSFGVARTSEAKKLRAAGCNKPIIVLSPLLSPNDLSFYKQLNLTPMLFCDKNIEALVNACNQQKINYWLKINTGMHRLGLNEKIPPSIMAKAQVVATHMHSADQIHDASIDTQATRFYNKLLESTTNSHAFKISIANSATLLRQKTSDNYQQWLHTQLKSFADKQEIIRPGIMLYGADPLSNPNSISQTLQPVMTFTAPIIDIRHIAAGESVGYSGRWKAQRASVIATVAVGYGDGYPRHAKSGTPILIQGQQASLAGNVSMDMIGVDITDLITQNMQIEIGDSAILWGQDLPVTTIAQYAQTISYPLLTGITDRVERIYV